MEQQPKQNWLGIGTLIAVIALVAFFFGRVFVGSSGTNPTPPPFPSSQPTQSTTQGCIDYTEAQNHLGENTCVKGTIVQVFVSNKGTTFLNYCSDYRTCPFSAVIFNSSAGNFPNVSSYQGHKVTIKGYLRTYQGRPEIILNTSDQIVNVE